MTQDDPQDDESATSHDRPNTPTTPDVSSTRIPESTRRLDTGEKSRTPLLVGGSVGAVVLLAAGLAIGGAKMAENSRETGPAPSQPTAEAPAVPGPVETAASTPEVKNSSTESEARFATYLDTLNSQQKAVRESLTPDSLAAMDTGKLTETFTVNISEVAGADGVVDPALYAEAFTARNEAILTSGCSSVEYAKWGGLSNFGKQEMAATVNTYFTPETTALFGYSGDSKSTARTLTICSTIDLLKQGSSPLNLEPYHLRSTVDEASVKAVSPVEFSFDTTSTDNVDIDLIRSKVGLDIAPTNEIMKWDISNLKVATDGRVSANFSNQIISN